MWLQLPCFSLQIKLRLRTKKKYKLGRTADADEDNDDTYLSFRTPTPSPPAEEDRDEAILDPWRCCLEPGARDSINYSCVLEPHYTYPSYPTPTYPSYPPCCPAPCHYWALPCGGEELLVEACHP